MSASTFEEAELRGQQIDYLAIIRLEDLNHDQGSDLTALFVQLQPTHADMQYCGLINSSCFLLKGW